MPFKTFTAGVLTASDVNTFLMQQAVITCTSTTRPSSPVEGMTIYETDTDFLRTYSGTGWESTLLSGAWRTWTPTLGVDGAGTAWAMGNATSQGNYLRVGRQVLVRVRITFGSTSTFGTGQLMMSVPASLDVASTVNAKHPLGPGRADDVSAGTAFHMSVYRSSNVGNVVFNSHAASGTYATVDGCTSTVPMTWASGDILYGTFIYETSVV